MKKLLGISILLNLSLLCVVVSFLAGRKKENFSAAPASLSQASAVATAPDPSASDTLPAAQPKPFRWSQLEAPDYATYISNLRSIGCPEQTILDIVSADVDAAIFAPRREQLNEKAQSGGSAISIVAQKNLEAGLKALNRDETAFIASLLGWPAPSDGDAAVTVAEVPVALPLVFRNVDLSALKLEVQINVIAGLQRRFAQEVGDPNDPAYRERWQKAEAEANNRLKAMMGWKAYQAFYAKAHSRAPTQTAATGNQ